MNKTSEEKNKQKITKWVGNDRHLVIHVMILLNELNISMRHTSRIFMAQLWRIGPKLLYIQSARTSVYFCRFSCNQSVLFTIDKCLRYARWSLICKQTYTRADFLGDVPPSFAAMTAECDWNVLSAFQQAAGNHKTSRTTLLKFSANRHICKPIDDDGGH